jgi:hypothetical protein
MKKFYISNKEDLNEQEIKTGCVSYGRIIKRYISDLVLCNNIGKDYSVYDNMQYNENFYKDTEDLEIYQHFLCNLTGFEKETLLEYGIILSYSDQLDLDILCVDHLGTNWDYVITDIKWTDNWDEM